MSWLDETCLDDLDDAAKIELRCPRCGYVSARSAQAMKAETEDRRQRLSEIAAQQRCPGFGCAQRGLDCLVLPAMGESNFVSGLA